MKASLLHNRQNTFKNYVFYVWHNIGTKLSQTGTSLRFTAQIPYPEFDTKNNKKVSEALILLACGTFPNFAVTRYFSCLLVSAQIFFIFLTGTISLDVQKPNAS